MTMTTSTCWHRAKQLQLNIVVGALDSSPLFDLPLNDVGPARSVWTGAPADDAPRSTATEPTGTGTAGTLVSSASNDATTLISSRSHG